MTNNQIQFYKAREEARHNAAVESETKLHNRAQESIGWGNIGATYADISEKNRHNVETERINWYSAEKLGNLQDTEADFIEGPKTEYTETKTDYVGAKANRERQATAIDWLENLRKQGYNDAAIAKLQAEYNLIVQREGKEAAEKWRSRIGIVNDVVGGIGGIIGIAGKGFGLSDVIAQHGFTRAQTVMPGW